MVYPWHEQPLAALLERKSRFPHALLICGREGIGKLALAEALARALLCEKPGAGGEACGKCASCVWTGQRSHPDLRRLEPEILSESREPGERPEKKPSLEIKIEQVREIAGFIAMTSHHAGPKIVLIHPAEALTVNAANALLKNLEEPPPGTYFLLVAHRWHGLLPTIRSRCERIALPAPANGAARRWLEEQKVAGADLALAQAGGAPLAARNYDEPYWQQRETLLKGISGAPLDPLHIAEQIRESAPVLVVGLLQKWSFDLAWHKLTGKVRYNPDYASEIGAAAQNIQLRNALRLQRHLAEARRIASHPLNARLFLEQLLLDYAGLLRGHAGANVG